MRRGVWLSILLLTVLSAGYSLVTPAGEAPDEPAHLEYVDTLIETRELPSMAPVGRWHYESHQPPLDYMVSAALSQAVNDGPVGLLARDPAVRTAPRHLEITADGGGPARLQRLRLARIFWLPLLLIAVFLFLREGQFPYDVTLATLIATGATPQILWLAGVVTNDLSLAFFSAISMYLLVRCMKSRQPQWPALALMLAVLAALLTKASGVALVPALAAGAAWSAASGRRRSAFAITLAGIGAVSSWICFNLGRYGSFLPSVPRIGGPEVHLGNLIADPLWPLKVIATYWARFGWLNVSLPLAWYALFAIVTGLVGLGVLLSIRRRPRSIAAIAVTLLLTNAALQAIYLAAYDYQTQGRYLFPSISAVAFFLGVSLDRMRGRLRQIVLLAVPLLMLVAAVAGIWTISHAYR